MRKKFYFLHSKTYFCSVSLIPPAQSFPINRTPLGGVGGTYCIVLHKVAKLQVYVVVSVSQSWTDINCWRTDNECVCIHKMYSDITGETQIFILGTGICKCHMLFTITGINVNMTAVKG